ncbi:MAG: histidine ammonia-lyase, partial [Comamonadaceae bacterium]
MSPSSSSLVLRPGRVTLADLRLIGAGGVQLSLDPAALAGMADSKAAVDRIVEEDQVVYGINTGFGKLASTKIAHDRLAELQRNLVLSHSVGTGDALPDDVVRMVLATKAVSLARGHSGVRPALVDALL